jgi:hypothetical protein
MPGKAGSNHPGLAHNIMARTFNEHGLGYSGIQIIIAGNIYIF